MEKLIFRQERIGKGGKPFICYKIQTMYEGVDYPMEQKLTGIKHCDDPRLIPSRKWLRKTGIDELPQLINVLLGDMSLFGGRPVPLAEYQNLKKGMRERYVEQKPGLIGSYLFLDSDLTPHQKNDAYRRLVNISSRTRGKKIILYVNVICATIRGLIDGKNY